MTTDTVICATTEASCICCEPIDHDGPHVCPCGGSWTVEDGQFKAFALPGLTPDWVIPT